MTPVPKVHPYESAYVSAFIYALGRLDGLQSKSSPDAEVLDPLGMTLLLTQNPLEKVYGDVAGAWQGHLFLLEFKLGRHVASELEKELRPKLLTDLWEDNQDSKEMRSLANRGHYLVYPRAKTAGVKDLCFEPYPSIYPQAGADKEQSMWFNTFLSRLKWSSRQLGLAGLEGNEFERYLTYLDGFDKSDHPTSKRIAGLLVGVDPTGRVLLMRYDGITQLIAAYKVAVENRQRTNAGPTLTSGRGGR